MAKKTIEDFPTHSYSSDEKKEKLLRIVRLNNPESYPFDNFHSHQYNEIMVFIKGGGLHNINFTTNTIENNALHLLAARDLHWVERDRLSEGFALIYKEQFLIKLQEFTGRSGLTDFFSYSKIINLNEEEATDFHFLIMELFKQKEEHLYGLNLAASFLAKIAETFEDQVCIPKKADPIIPDLIELINQHYKSQCSSSEYASMLHLPLRTLNKRVQSATGFSVHKLIQEKVLKEAKRMIVQSSHQLHISSISFDLGFNEPAHFCNWFKKLTGVNPKDFKVHY